MTKTALKGPHDADLASQHAEEGALLSKNNERLIGIQAGRGLGFFGGQSYALYLLHVIVVGLSFRMFAAIGEFRWAPAELFVLMATAMSVAMASGVYTFFELCRSSCAVWLPNRLLKKNDERGRKVYPDTYAPRPLRSLKAC
jgi:hypothetical protein